MRRGRSSRRSAARGRIVVAGTLASVGIGDEPATLIGRAAGSWPAPTADSARGSSSCSGRTAKPGTNLAELGVGTNERAQLTGQVLEDEKILGTVHIAFGASAGIGGTVTVPIHLDAVVLDATLDVDGRRVLDAGRYVLDAIVTLLLAVPNVSQGRDAELIDDLARAFDARLLDVHTDSDHHRSVFTLAGPPGALAPAVLAGAAEAVRRIDIGEHRGEHPRIGAVDVAPIVYLDGGDRGAACAEALVLGDLLGERARTAGAPVRRARRRPHAGPTAAQAARTRSGRGSRTASCVRTSARGGCTRRPARCLSVRGRR